ncbi:hypothetical protein EDB85DRAFT_2204652 [Lactarius pseudohatsudake]|nr:hypothetical protein EDB85DRAFT_2204652 [Lactarius pseudohatsudake]
MTPPAQTTSCACCRSPTPTPREREFTPSEAFQVGQPDKAYHYKLAQVLSLDLASGATQLVALDAIGTALSDLIWDSTTTGNRMAVRPRSLRVEAAILFGFVVPRTDGVAIFSEDSLKIITYMGAWLARDTDRRARRITCDSPETKRQATKLFPVVMPLPSMTDGSIADDALYLNAAMQYCQFRSATGTMRAIEDMDGRDLTVLLRFATKKRALGEHHTLRSAFDGRFYLSIAHACTNSAHPFRVNGRAPEGR